MLPVIGIIVLHDDMLYSPSAGQTSVGKKQESYACEEPPRLWPRSHQSFSLTTHDVRGVCAHQILRQPIFVSMMKFAQSFYEIPLSDGACLTSAVSPVVLRNPAPLSSANKRSVTSSVPVGVVIMLVSFGRY